MASVNTYGNVAGENQLSAENAEFYSRTMLDRRKGELIITNYAEKSLSIPKNNGDLISFRRMGALPLTTAPITEGVNPAAIVGTISKVSTSVQQYGTFLKLTDRLQLQSLDPLVTKFSEEIGIQSGESTETIVLNTLMAGTNVMYGGGKTARNLLTTADKMTSALLLRIATQLKESKCKPITLPDGSKGYLAFLHPRQAFDLKQDADFKAMNTYVDTKNLVNGTIGKMHGIYCVEYDFAPTLTGAGASGVDVYQGLVISEGFFGIPDIEGSSKAEIIIKTPSGNNDNTGDALNLISTIGWKSLFAVIRLDELRGVRIETGSTY